MKQKHWQVSVFDKTSETIKDDTFYTTDTEAYLTFELIDEDFTPDTATVAVYNAYGKATINASAEIVDGIVQYEMPVDAIGHPGGWRTQVIFTKANEDYTTKIIEFDVDGHLLDDKKPSIVEIENWSSFIKHAGELVEDWEQLIDATIENATQFQTESEETINKMIFSGEAEIQTAKQDAKESALKAQQAMTDYLNMLGVDVATLGADGKLTADQIPALAINDTFTVYSKEEITELVAQRGDVAILIHDKNVSDAFILTEDAPEVLDNWIKLGVSYVAEAGHAETATNAVNAQKINGHRVVMLSQEQYDLGAKDPNTVYLVGDF